ncbi:Stage V sporulation protein D [bioreactor metagenome]|uniref:Stage V sporulation protein D n=1 Tax=bioreactor metagenome TaxID=1076179 RepID=A0A644Z698_9ZZZZ
MPNSYENFIDAVDGYNLHLTLNATIQYYAERILQEGIETFEVRNGGFCIIMDPKTGAIYAMANVPNYDLNNPRAVADEETLEKLAQMKADPSVTEEQYLKALGDAQFEQWRSKAVNDTYEPGSTFKSLVVAAALEEGAVNENTSFYCTGSVQLAGFTIRCHKRTGHGSQTLREAVMNSCNPAFIAIGQKLGAEKFYQYLEDYGLLTTTGIDMQGEGKGNVWDRNFFLSEQGISSLATASFGQRLTVTPISLITAAASVINGGYLMEPYVLESVTDQAGNTVSVQEPTVVRQVISEQTSEKVRSILESVVGDGGTGKNAYVAGYRIGGKTGTSETLVKDEFIVSFLGFAPADDPKVIVLLAYDSPTPNSPGSNYTSGGWYISGGNMAALMAGRLIGDVLDYMGVEKQYTQDELSGADTLVPKVTDVSLTEAQRPLKNSGLAWRVVGSGSAVTGQIPVQGASIPKNSQVVLYLGEEKPTALITVPDLTGLSPQTVRDRLQSAGLYLRATGAQKYYTEDTIAASQSVLGGTQVEPGSVIEVFFIDNQVRDYAAN